MLASVQHDASDSFLFDSGDPFDARSEEHTSELQSQSNIVCRLLLEKKNTSSTCVAPPTCTKTTSPGISRNTDSIVYSRCSTRPMSSDHPAACPVNITSRRHTATIL